jgi:hypothetical protein
MRQRFARFFAFRVGLAFFAGFRLAAGLRFFAGLRFLAGLRRAAGVGTTGAGHDTATFALIAAPLTAIAVSDTHVSRPL